MKKWGVIAIIAVIVLAVVAGVIWYWQKNKPEPVNAPVAENVVGDDNSAEEWEDDELQGDVVSGGEEIDISGWQTYRNEEYGFEFKYPPTLSKTINENYMLVLLDDFMNINIKVLNEKLDPNTIKSPIGIVTKESLERVEVGEKESYRFSDGDMGYGGNSYRIPLGNDHVLFLWFVTEGGSYIYEDTIISTFKFIK